MISGQLCNLPATVLVNRSLFTIEGNQQRLRVLCTAAILPEDQNRLPRRDIFVHDHTDPFATLEHSIADSAKRFPSNINPNILLPEKIYEALPAAYISVGTLFILGAIYIGIGHGPMVGYLAVGLSCILAGVTVNSIRRRERSR